MQRIALLVFIVLVACVSAQAVLLYKTHAHAAQLIRREEQRRQFCRWHRSAIDATKLELAAPRTQAAAAARYAWLTSPAFAEICDDV